MRRDASFTVASAVPVREVASARVLAGLVAARHPDAEIVVLLLDDLGRDVDERAEPFTVLRLHELDWPDAHIAAVTATGPLEVVELLRPHLLHHLLDHTGGPVVWLGPSIWVRGCLTPLLDAAGRAGIALVPRRMDVTQPAGEPAGEGAFDSGVLAVHPGPAAGRFLRWWSARHAVDPRVLDPVPAFFECELVDDPGMTFDLRDFDPRRPWWPPGAPDPERYAAALCHARDGLSDKPYAYERVPGVPDVDGDIRVLLAGALCAGERLADLFAPDSTAFVDFVNRSGGGGAGAPPLVLRVYDRRPDLQEAFPDPTGVDGLALREWAVQHGLGEEPLLKALLCDVAPAARVRPPVAAGPVLSDDGQGPVVTVHGFLDETLGLGQAARFYVRALEHAGLPVRTHPVPVPRAGVVPRMKAPAQAPGGVSLVCFNAPEVLEFERHGLTFAGSSAVVAAWAWEVGVVPDVWARAASRFDEVWVNTRFEAEVLGAALPVPVRIVPFAVTVDDGAGPAPLDEGGGTENRPFTFLFAFDFFSTVERKNPLGVIRAFTSAFRPREGPRLVVKSVHGDLRPEALARLRWEARDRPDVTIVDEDMDRRGVMSLLAACDCFVSLHRSEGFGLVIAEAMAMGKPVIATGWSGNVDFTHEANSYLVRYELAEVPEGNEQYPAGATWAEPDLTHAAELMREVWQDEEGRARRGEAGRDEVRRLYSLEAVASDLAAAVRRVARPRLSVVVATTHTWPVGRRILDILIPQLEEVGGELIFADGDVDGCGVPDDLVAATPRLTVVRSPGASVFDLRAQATRQARGEIIAFTEDHCVPGPDWCARTLAAHAEHPEAALVGGAVRNGSTGCAVDWANFVTTFAAYAPPFSIQDERRPLSANLSVKRSATRDWSTAWPGWVESALVPRLHAEGKVVLDDSFPVEHVQSFGVPRTIANHFHNGRVTGGFMSAPSRRERARVARYYLGRPPEEFRFTMRMCQKSDELRRASRRAAPYVALLTMAHNLGVATGVMAGPGRSANNLE